MMIMMIILIMMLIMMIIIKKTIKVIFKVFIRNYAAARIIKKYRFFSKSFNPSF